MGATLVLVHGGWAGGWVWEKITPALEAAGHRVLTPDLPGHGADRTPVEAVTLDSYVDTVTAVIDAEPGPVVLVGHSSGGVVVTQAAERRADRVGHLVYVCAYLPADGQTLLDLGQTDSDQLILPNLVFAPDGASAHIQPEEIGPALFADGTDADLERFRARMCPEPLAPAATPVKVTAERFGRIPKTYVECRRDRGISLELQRRMHSAAGCDVLTLDTGHMPQYVAPAQLAQILVDVAAR